MAMFNSYAKLPEGKWNIIYTKDYMFFNQRVSMFLHPIFSRSSKPGSADPRRPAGFYRL